MHDRNTPLRAALIAAAAGCVPLALAATAFAHVEPMTNHVPKAGARGVITMHIEHGCKNAAGTLFDTNRITTQPPKAFTGVTVPAHAGWTGTVTRTSTGTRVTWTANGTTLGKHTPGAFKIAVTYPSRKGRYGLPTVQYCGGRSTAWIERTVNGVEPDFPLPILTVR